jgi:threonine dehydrogenase-like Zn-dependent dehydrogenase
MEPVVLGHEFVGVVEAVGSQVKDIKIGDRVVANPVVYSNNLRRFQMMGVDYDGAFAEYIVCSDAQLYTCDMSMDQRHAAYVEPVAAALASLETGICPTERGYVYGEGRIAELTFAVLRRAGFSLVEQGVTGEPGSYDFVIETVPMDLNQVIALVRDRGLVVLKSRPWKAVNIDLLTLVRREIRLQGAHYGRFEKSIEWLRRGELEIDYFLGPIHPFEEFESLFEPTEDEQQKHFFRCTG